MVPGVLRAVLMEFCQFLGVELLNPQQNKYMLTEIYKMVHILTINTHPVKVVAKFF